MRCPSLMIWSVTHNDEIAKNTFSAVDYVTQKPLRSYISHCEHIGNENKKDILVLNRTRSTKIDGQTNSPLIRSSENEGALTAREVLAYNVRHMRHHRAWSQEALALEAGLDRTFVAHVERGARNISLDNIERLACALLVPIHMLLYLEC